MRYDKPRDPRSLRARYARLSGWIAFVYGRADQIPGVPLEITRRADSAVRLKESMRQVLLKIANRVSANPRKLRMIDFPRPPQRLIIAGSRVTVVPLQSPQDSFISALADLDFQRLRICAQCRTLFVAFHAKSKACSARCSNAMRQQTFYTKNRRQILEAKRKQYWQNRKRNKAARLARKQGRDLTGRLLRG